MEFGAEILLEELTFHALGFFEFSLEISSIG